MNLIVVLLERLITSIGTSKTFFIRPCSVSFSKRMRHHVTAPINHQTRKAKKKTLKYIPNGRDTIKNVYIVDATNPVFSFGFSGFLSIFRWSEVVVKPNTVTLRLTLDGGEKKETVPEGSGRIVLNALIISQLCKVSRSFEFIGEVVFILTRRRKVIKRFNIR